MAETTVHLMLQDVTVTFYDATGTPLTYTVKLTEGTITFTEGKKSQVWSSNTDGTRLTKRDGPPTRFAQVVFRCKCFSVGDDGTDVNLLDIVRQDGVVGSTWVSTDPVVSGERKLLGCKLTIADRVYGTGPTTEKGGIYDFQDGDFLDGAEVEATNDGGWMLSATFESKNMLPVVTRNS